MAGLKQIYARADVLLSFWMDYVATFSHSLSLFSVGKLISFLCLLDRIVFGDGN